MALSFRPAANEDAGAVALLVNAAYRGEGAKKGWTTEADLLGGQRTDRDKVLEMIAGGRVELAFEEGGLAGCVHLEKDASGACYLGMLTVDPDRQRGGLGKALLERSEAVARGWGCRMMRMTVIHSRAELIAFYERRGYRRTGETAPFPVDDPRYGIPKSQDLHFVVLEKPLPPERRLERLKRFYVEHEHACTAGLFIAGFLFDTLAVGRIDKLHNIIHQAVYLSLCAWFTGLELRQTHGEFSPPPRLAAAWRYHAGATHFMLGTLLNIYTLFYFKSASLSVSFAFMLLLAGLLAVNELRPGLVSGTTLRMTLFSLCLVSYFGYLLPVLIGAIGPWIFVGSLLTSTTAAALLCWRLIARLPGHPHIVLRHLGVPYAFVALGFAFLYFVKLIPPVPLALSSIGIYHEVRREGERFALTMTRPRWKFWQRGDQTFEARPGDRLFCFASVFSPTNFKERLQVRWLYKDPELGWQDADAIPLDIVGGRDEGWRGYTVKAKHKPGKWRVRVETSDGRELGRVNLKVVAADGPPRPSRTIWK